MATNINRLEQMTEQELWVQIGSELTLEEEHALPLDARDLRDRAKAWFSASKKALEDRICTPDVRKIFDGGDILHRCFTYDSSLSACAQGIEHVLRKLLEELDEGLTCTLWSVPLSSRKSTSNTWRDTIHANLPAV
jgi:hypothetical protein